MSIIVAMIPFLKDSVSFIKDSEISLQAQMQDETVWLTVNQMAVTHKAGISSFAYCFACGSRSFIKPQHIMTPHDLIDKAAALGADVVQFGDNMPLEVYSNHMINKRCFCAFVCGESGL